MEQVRSASPLEWMGAKTLKALVYVTELATLVVRAVWEFLTAWRRGGGEAFRIISRQILFTGVDALPVVSTIALMLGVIVITQAGTQLPRVGADKLIGNIIVLTVIRELGPLLAAFIVIWRSGTAIAVELGNMQVAQEVTALELMGISVARFVIMPRLVGMAVAMVCLAFYFDFVAVLGGFLVAKLELTIPFAAFARSVLHALTSMDIVITAFKSALFGLIIASVGCHHGLSVGLSATEVPQQTTRAMINAVTMCLLLDIVVALAVYL